MPEATTIAWPKKTQESARRLGSKQLSQPFSIGGWQDDVHDLTDLVIHRRSPPKQLRSFLSRRHNPARIDARAQHSNLSLKQLHPRVVSGTHPLRQKYKYRVENGIHPISFRSEASLKKPKNTGWRAVDTFPNPLVHREGVSKSVGHARESCARKKCGSLCGTFFEQHVVHGEHVHRS